jgi:hypothetical protein
VCISSILVRRTILDGAIILQDPNTFDRACWVSTNDNTVRAVGLWWVKQ